MKPVAIFRHHFSEGPGYLAEFLDANQLPWQLIRIDENEAVPTDASLFSGLAFMGGPMSVNDALPWIEPVMTLIREAVACDIPVLGHCLGGQLMSRALGGSVRKNAVKEIGWGEVSVSANAEAAAWFGDSKSATVFHWHGETFSTPNGATHLLSSKHCANQAYAIGKHLALQCHIEMTAAMIKQWCEVGSVELSENSHTAGVQSATAMQALSAQNLPALHVLAQRIYSKWAQGLVQT
jgi:GMP synthase-like glutamine amidotransferase